MKVTFLLFLLFLISCNNDKNISSGKKPEPKVGNRITTIMNEHTVKGYSHYLTIENYLDTNINYFIDIADKYRDTCSVDIPVWDITFCLPFNFQPHYDSRDNEPLNKNSVVKIIYTEETLHKEHPDISTITVYKSGVANEIPDSTITKIGRRKNENLYDSNGLYDRDWIKQYDAKFKTNFSRTSTD